MAKISKKPIREYPCTQLELYACSRIGLASFKENLVIFADIKGYYTNTWVGDFKQEIKNASKLPDFQARDEGSETANILLEQKGEKCTTKWQFLKRYIVDAYPKKLHKPKLEAAGSLLYEKAANNNWEVLKGMMETAGSFITNNTSDLTANNVMPAGFPAQFTDIEGEFILLYDDFTDAQQDAEQQTTTKIDANNAIYEKLIGMFKDGQLLFQDDKATQERFIFAQVLKLVRGSKGVTKQFGIKPLSKLTIKRVVANSKFANVGPVTIAFAKGSLETQPPDATIVEPDTSVDIPPEKSRTITVFNNDETEIATCSCRIVKD